MTSIVNKTNNSNIDALLWGYKWDVTIDTNLTYSFPTGAAQYYDADQDPVQTGYVNNGIVNFAAFTPLQQAAVRTILDNVSSFSKLTFSRTTAEDADLRFAEATSVIYTNDPTVATTTFESIGSATSNPPELSFGTAAPETAPYAQGDTWLHNNDPTNPNDRDYDTPVLGNFAYTAGIMHEIGHNLGLKHTHQSHTKHGDTFGTASFDHDSNEYSVMAYRAFPGAPLTFNVAMLNNNYPQTFMQDDIAALQLLYGANYNYLNTDTRYSWSETTGEMFINSGNGGLGQPNKNYVFMTLWDGGGTDTYEFFNYKTNMSIDLAPGAWTVFDTSAAHLQRANLGNNQMGGPDYFARGNVANALIDPNNPNETASLIENVIAGTGNDVLLGNTVNNMLSGYDGNDVMDGREGLDTLQGWRGDDNYYLRDISPIFSDGVLVREVYDTIVEYDRVTMPEEAGSGIDTVHVTAVERQAFASPFTLFTTSYTLPDNIEMGVVEGERPFNITGNDLENKFYGNAAANTFDGGSGNDVDVVDYGLSDIGVQVFLADQALNGGGALGDRLISIEGVAGTRRVDQLYGDAKSNNLWGFDDSDELNGGAGPDGMDGGDGADSFWVDNGAEAGGDVVLGGDGFDQIITDPSLGTTGLRLNVFAEGTPITGEVNLVPNTSAAFGVEMIFGASGNDWIDASRLGRAEGVQVLGGAGNDTFFSGAGKDSFFGDADTDTIVYAGVSSNYAVTAFGSRGTAFQITDRSTGVVDDIHDVEKIRFNDGETAPTGLITTPQTFDGTARWGETIVGGTGTDTISYANANYAIYVDLLRDAGYAQAGNAERWDQHVTSVENLTGATNFINYLHGDGHDNVLIGGENFDWLVGRGGSNTLDGRGGIDFADYYETDQSVSIDLTIGKAVHSTGTDTLISIEQFRGTNKVDTFIGDVQANYFHGMLGNDNLRGGGGQDTLVGSGGDDVLNGDEGEDRLSGEDDDDALFGGADNDALAGGAGKDTLVGGSGTNTLDGGFGDDRFMLGNVSANFVFGGDLTNVASIANWTDNAAGFDFVNGGGGIDTADFSGFSSATWVDLEYAGEATYPALAAWTLDRTDLDEAAGTWRALADLDGVENIVGTAAMDWIWGDAAANAIGGGGGDDWLDGRAGADALVGGLGSDEYIVDNAADVVTEVAGQGTDRVYASVSYTLGSGQEVEKLTTTDNAGTAAINLTGNGFANTIVGNAGANTLNGAGGADALIGFGGDDFYFVDNAFDTVAEGTGEGANDRVFASVSYTLRANTQVEKLTTTDNAGTAAINLTGNGFANTIVGNAGANTLNGAGGADALIGFGGDDFYFVDNAFDTVAEGTGEGANDRVFASVSYTLRANTQVEKLTTTDNAGTAAINLTGNGFANTIVGNAGANTLNGAGGADALIGFGGDDFYFVDNAFDTVAEGTGEGANDRVFASVSYTLRANTQVEKLTTTDNAGTAAINLTGNGFANTIVGNAGANTLNGAGGADALIGFGGDDFYFVDNAFDTVAEGTGEGANDRVFASVSYTLRANTQVEKLTTTDNAGTAAINLTGNGFANTIVGNAGANTLNGAGGADALIGFGGDDFYYVDNAADAVYEGAGQGSDRVFASVSHTLRGGQEIEKLTTADNGGTSAINLTGNEFANTIYGNAGANTINGGLGNDTLVGLGGSDTFVFNAALGRNNIDAVADFAAGDRIALDRAIFGTAGPAGQLAASAFFAGAAAHDADDRVIYNAATGALFYDPDGIGAGAAVQFATVAGYPALSAVDFLVV